MSPTESLDGKIKRYESHLERLDPLAQDVVFKFFAAFGFFEQIVKHEGIYTKKNKWKGVCNKLEVDFSNHEIHELKRYCEQYSPDEAEIAWSRFQSVDGFPKYFYEKEETFNNLPEKQREKYKLIGTICTVRNSLFHGAKATGGFGSHQLKNIQKAYAALARIIQDNENKLNFSQYIEYACH